ncbi:heterogeneous nuclear ribonucleoprotein hrp1 [Phaffia rhodozyma]|uniref:Heterogeneous nuclear ribonucleoprotein hrp1 n=1 Tax=Phaffia rhodozyma TaxID=264483 RepID=A0A0F7SXC5_PHARH|nr:heterogeneous nuclear ribonucleoprotein hrp1 [Phaffia rhodozyma]
MASDEEQDNLDLYGPDDDEDVLYDDNEDEDGEPATVDAMIPSSTNVDASKTSSVPSANEKATPSSVAASTSGVTNMQSASGVDTEDALAKKIAEITGAAESTSSSSAYSSGGLGAGLGAPQQQHANGDAIRPRDMPDEGKMFVGGLNWETTDDNLRTYFSQFGAVEHCTIMRDPTGRSRGFAFLTFEQSSSVDKVLAQEHQLDGKQIDPKRAIPHTEHRKSAKIFVGGLLPSTTVDILRDFFAQYGTVLDAQVMVDRDSSRSKGFGFITFADEESCEKCLAVGMVEIDGKGVEVKRAQPRNGRDANTAVTTDRKSTKTDPYGGNVAYGGVGGPSSLPQNPIQLQQQLQAQQHQQPGLHQQQQFMMGGMGGMMPGMMGMGAGGPGGMDPNVMVQMYQRMMAGGMGNPGQMGMMNRPQMMNSGMQNPGFPSMMSSPGMYNPMLGLSGSPTGGASGNGANGGGASPGGNIPGAAGGAARGMMGMPGMMGMGMNGMGMGMMGGMGGMGMGLRPGMGMSGMPFMMPQAGGAAGGVGSAGSNAGSTAGRTTGGRSPSVGGQIQTGQQQQQQGMGPARFNTKGQSHFRPY